MLKIYINKANDFLSYLSEIYPAKGETSKNGNILAKITIPTFAELPVS